MVSNVSESFIKAKNTWVEYNGGTCGQGRALEKWYPVSSNTETVAECAGNKQHMCSTTGDDALGLVWGEKCAVMRLRNGYVMAFINLL